jgi:carbon-monoxide dehydrogenase medium subunit
MKNFELTEPTTLEGALALLDPEDTSVRPVAGGTALLLMMKTRLFQPTRLVSLRRLNGPMSGLETGPNGELRIGAMTRLAALEVSPLVAASVPVISRALVRLANVRIRNVATVGGHLAHGDPHMDLPPILLTLDARVRVVGPQGERWIAIGDLFVGYYQTALAKDELITELVIPAQGSHVHAWYEKYTALSADDWPAVGAAVWFRLQAGAIAEARIAIGAATERPTRIAGAESVLTGAVPDEAAFLRAAEAAAEEVNPLADIRGSASYKREMVRVHVRRALQNALREAD